MNFEILELAVIAIVVLVAVVALAVLRIRKPSEKKEYKPDSSFFTMGIIWFIAALIYNLYKGTYILNTDAPLFNLGLIFMIAGGIGLIAEYLRR